MVKEDAPLATKESTLGVRLRRARRDQSLSTTASAAEISPAYLQKLEAGAVRQPSPHVLYQLSQSLNIDYAELMELAGYVVPGKTRASQRRRRNELTYALNSEELTDEEARELSHYLDWYRQRDK